MAFLFSFHCDSLDQGSAKSRSGKLVCRGQRTLAKQSRISLACSAGCSQAAKWPPPVQDVVMDQVWHPPIDPAPRGAEGLARIYADAYGNLQPDRRSADGEAFP